MRQAVGSSHPSDLIPKMNISDPSLDISIAQVTFLLVPTKIVKCIYLLLAFRTFTFFFLYDRLPITL